MSYIDKKCAPVHLPESTNPDPSSSEVNRSERFCHGGTVQRTNSKLMNSELTPSSGVSTPNPNPNQPGTMSASCGLWRICPFAGRSFFPVPLSAALRGSKQSPEKRDKTGQKLKRLDLAPCA